MSSNFTLIARANKSSIDRFKRLHGLVKKNAELLVGAFKDHLLQPGDGSHEPNPPTTEDIHVWLHNPAKDQKVSGLEPDECILFDGKLWYFGIGFCCDSDRQQVVSFLVKCEEFSGPRTSPFGEMDVKATIGFSNGSFDLPHQVQAMVNSMSKLIVKKFESTLYSPYDKSPILFGYTKTVFEDCWNDQR